ncbi:hypothetical protein PENSPDRAFT_669365 [Peniophora sp. CONT]|nr:hypothetical protein PENSPDRAFT_669365 [Peniophora sp. CONT]
MASSPTEAVRAHPLQLPPDADPEADRRFPYAGGGGREVHPDDPEQKYLIPYCYHGWRAQYRRPTWDNVRVDLWGCEGYIWGKHALTDGYDCGYKETEDVHPRYGVTTLQTVNMAWDGISLWTPKPDVAFFKERQASARREAFAASRTPPASPNKRTASSTQAPALMASTSSPKKTKNAPSPRISIPLEPNDKLRKALESSPPHSPTPACRQAGPVGLGPLLRGGGGGRRTIPLCRFGWNLVARMLRVTYSSSNGLGHRHGVAYYDSLRAPSPSRDDQHCLDVSLDLVVHNVYLDPMDAYTLELLDGIWCLALCHPSALDELIPDHYAWGEPVLHCFPKHAPHRDLAWSISKLRDNGYLRLSCPGTSPVHKLPVEACEPILRRLARPRLLECFQSPPRLIDQTPTLWVPMVMGFGSLMTARALRLSKRELLDIKIDRRTRWNLSHFLIFEHLDRIHSVNVVTESLNPVRQLALALRASPAPELSSIFICPRVDFEGHRRFVLEDDIFHSMPPSKLCSVYLFDCTMTLPSPLFSPSLSSLKLERCDTWPNLTSLIDTLATLPGLVIFSWRMGLNTIARTNSPVRLTHANFLASARPPATLLRLRVLEIECPADCAAALMQHLAITPACEVHLTDDYMLTGARPHDISIRDGLLASLTGSLGDHLSRVFPAHSNSGYDAVYVDVHPDSPGKGCLSLSGRSVGDSRPRCSVSLLVADEHENRMDEDVLSFLIRSILQWPAMSVAATCFATDHEVFSSAELWTNVLGRLPRVCQLHVENNEETDASDTVVGLARALNISLDVVPSLSGIHLRRLSFPLLSQQHLAAAARRRYALSCPAIALHVDECLEFDRDEGRESVDIQSEGALYLQPSSTCCGRGREEPRDSLAWEL